MRALKILVRFGLAAFFVSLTAWTLLQSAVRLVNFADPAAAFLGDERAALQRKRMPGGLVYRMQAALYRPGDVTLAFRQSDFTLYGKGPWLNDIDTALKPLYELQSVEAVHAWLRERNVRFVILPNYTNPTLYRTTLGDFLADLRYVEPVVSFRGFRLFRIEDAPRPEFCEAIAVKDIEARAFLGDPLPQSASSLLMSAFGNSNYFESNEVAAIEDDALLASSGRPDGALRLRWGHRYQLLAALGSGPVRLPPADAALRQSSEDQALTFSVNVAGKGFMAIDLIEYLPHGEIIRSRQWDGLIDRRIDHLGFSARLHPQAYAYRFVLFNPARAAGDITLGQLQICRRNIGSKREWRPGAALTRWDAGALTIGCHRLPREQRSLFCRREKTTTALIQKIGPRAIWHGHFNALLTSGFHDHFWFPVRRWFEGTREWMERYPNATLVKAARPFYDFLDWSDRKTPRERVLVRIKARGFAIYNAYLQWTGPDGKRDERYAGTFYLDDPERISQFAVEVPAGSHGFQIALLGESSHVEVTELAVTRLEGGPE